MNEKLTCMTGEELRGHRKIVEKIEPTREGEFPDEWSFDFLPSVSIRNTDNTRFQYSGVFKKLFLHLQRHNLTLFNDNTMRAQ